MCFCYRLAIFRRQAIYRTMDDVLPNGRQEIHRSDIWVKILVEFMINALKI